MTRTFSRTAPERREREAVERLAADEREEMLALIDWFVRRYPTPLARLKYIRRQTRDILASQRLSQTRQRND
jgi:hypothetical protein